MTRDATRRTAHASAEARTRRWIEGLFVVPELLVAYRRRHVIDAKPLVPDARGHVAYVDANCGLRVIRRRSGGRPLLWRHDPDHIKELVRQTTVR